MPKITRSVPLAPMEFRRQLGERIKRLREKRGSKQGDFAGALGISPAQLSRYETGWSDVTIQRLHQIAAALGTSMSKLLEGLL